MQARNLPLLTPKGKRNVAPPKIAACVTREPLLALKIPLSGPTSRQSCTSFSFDEIGAKSGRMALFWTNASNRLAAAVGRTWFNIWSERVLGPKKLRGWLMTVPCYLRQVRRRCWNISCLRGRESLKTGFTIAKRLQPLYKVQERCNGRLL